jgi:signal transduction histidine kinase/CheY-like chemotaxis protein
MAHALTTGESYEIETRAIFPDGSLHWRRSFGHVLRDDAGRPARHFGLIVDITEEKRAEEQRLQMQAQLQQTQRLEAIGELAGGIAHDFNNLLLAFCGYGELALGKLQESDLDVRADLEHMMTAADRASALTRQLLAFSSRQILQPQVVDLNDVVREEEGLLRRLIGEDIRIVTVLEAGAGCVDADPGQLGQVLMNLALNARHAMPDGGTLTIETGKRDLDEQLALALGAVAPGPYLRLTVRDTGVGMDAQTRERAFEPFYTTKPVGQGTGLGLATVYGIVKQSGGCIILDSQPGEGTAFTIYLPRTDAPKHASAEPQRPIPRTGSERILLVEDDESVKTLLTGQLRAQGYTVTDVSDPTQAIELAQDADCDLLITDVVMPEMNGRELAERLVAQRPQLKVIYMSGYTDQAIVERGILIQDINFLQKPFDSTELVTKVRDVLDAP